MALDPTGTAAPTGWGLGALGTPSVSTQPLAPRMQFTPEQVAQMRKEAMALQTPPTEPIRHWTQGLAELVRAIQGNREADFARQQETTGRQQGAAVTSSMLAPYLGGGTGRGAEAEPSTATADASATPTDASAIAGIESGGSKNPYALLGPVTKTGDRAHGKYQVMGANIPEWTQEALGKSMTPQEYLASPEAQEAVFKHKFGQYVQKYGPEGAAKAWFAGEHGMNNPNARDQLGTTVSSYARQFNAAAPTSTGPTGLLAPIAPPPPAPTEPPPVPANQASAAPPVRLAYAGNPPPGMIPSPSPGMGAQVNAIAGRPMPSGAAIPPGDFARAAAAMEAAKAQPGGSMGPSIPLPGPGAIPPGDFAKQAAAMEALKQRPGGSAGPSIPLGSPVPPPAVAAPPIAPPAPPPVPTGAGPVGPVSVGGAPLPPATPAMISAIGGGAAPPAAPGAPNPAAPIRVAQNGPLTSIAPSGAGAPSGLPQPLLPPTGQITQQQLTTLLANPWVPAETKNEMLKMIQQRGQVQSLPMEGGILQYDASGRRQWIPQTVYKEFESNGTKMQLEGTRAGPNEPMQWKPIVPGAGGPAQPGAPDYSTQAGRDAITAATASAKKGAETTAEAQAKYYNAVHTGLAGSALIAAQQKQNIDAARQIASSPDFIAGTFADSGLAMQKLAASIGINPNAAAGRELFNQIAAKILSDQMSGLKSMSSEAGEVGGRIFKPFLDMEEKASIKPDDTVPGIVTKLNFLDQQGNLFMKYADTADDYIKEHGRLDAGFDKAIRKEIAGSRIPSVLPQEPSAQPSDANAAWEAEMRKRNLLKPATAPVSQ